MASSIGNEQVVVLQPAQASSLLHSTINLGDLHEANGYLVRGGTLVLTFVGEAQ